MKKVTAALIEKNGKFLIAKRKKGGHSEGRWELPGGKLEPGETPEQCLARELKEEFDIETEVKGLLCSTEFAYHDIAIELLVYKVNHIAGDFKLIDHDEIRWVSPEEFDKYHFAEADRIVLDKFIKGSCGTREAIN